MKQITAFLFTLGFALSACAGDPTPPEAAIASAHPLATQAGYTVLEQGGNAFDAAVAVSAALAVVEPYSSGLGGGGFYLLHRASDGKNIFLDAREIAPAAATHDMYLNAAGEVQWDKMRVGGLAAGIPGTPAALAVLARDYGKLSLATSLQPAIKLAREGFAVDARLALALQQRADLLRQYCAAPCAFLPNGAPPGEGDTLRQPALADTLQALAERGAAGFYLRETSLKNWWPEYTSTVASGRWMIWQRMQRSSASRWSVKSSARGLSPRRRPHPAAASFWRA